MGRPELATDARFATHGARAERMAEIDGLISDWTRTLSPADLLAALEAGGVPAGRIFTATDMLSDPHYAAREMVLRQASYQGWEVPMTGIVPKFGGTPGSVRTTGAPLGAHTREVLSGIAELSPGQIEELEAAGIAYCADA
jgi:crotonobetainyl-CoA:carnitine CoA-transferase CaiB-like acyl-CoA transferase